MISTMLFITAVVILLYFLVFASGKKTLEQLRLDSRIIPMKIMATGSDTGNTLAFIIDGKVDKNKMKGVSDMGYESLKSKLGVRNDFCIFFEDKDGNLIDIGRDLGEEKEDVRGIGNAEFEISGYPCG